MSVLLVGSLTPFFSSVVADLALRLGPDSERSGKKLYKIHETLWLHKRGTSWLSQNKEKKHGNRFSALTPPVQQLVKTSGQ